MVAGDAHGGEKQGGGEDHTTEAEVEHGDLGVGPAVGLGVDPALVGWRSAGRQHLRGPRLRRAPTERCDPGGDDQ
jgi:hypothetical protein